MATAIVYPNGVFTSKGNLWKFQETRKELNSDALRNMWKAYHIVGHGSSKASVPKSVV